MLEIEEATRNRWNISRNCCIDRFLPNFDIAFINPKLFCRHLVFAMALGMIQFNTI
jgi:hypothetical protein